MWVIVYISSQEFPSSVLFLFSGVLIKIFTTQLNELMIWLIISILVLGVYLCFCDHWRRLIGPLVWFTVTLLVNLFEIYWGLLSISLVLKYSFVINIVYWRLFSPVDSKACVFKFVFEVQYIEMYLFCSSFMAHNSFLITPFFLVWSVFNMPRMNCGKHSIF